VTYRGPNFDKGQGKVLLGLTGKANPRIVACVDCWKVSYQHSKKCFICLSEFQTYHGISQLMLSL